MSKEELLKCLLLDEDLMGKEFEKMMGVFKNVDSDLYNYWDGKRSEAFYMVERIKHFLENKL